MSNPRDVDAPASPKPRTVEKREYFVEVPVQMPADGVKRESATRWALGPDTFAGPHPGTAEAVRAINKAKRPGEYRVVRVCWHHKIEAEQKTVMKVV